MVTCNVSSENTRTATDWGESGTVVAAFVVVMLQPCVLHDFTVNCCGVVLAPGNVTILLVVVPVSLAVSDMNV